jgi:hypothetical protein
MNKEKLKALVQYICYKCSDPSILGKTKLNKILFYSDFMAYLRYRQPITGERYVKHQFGPVSDHLDEVLDELVATDELVVRDTPYYDYAKKEFIARKMPDLGMFTANEISIVDDMIQRICRNFTAKEISKASHTKVWEAARIGEEIPYNTVYIHKLREMTPLDIDWARQQIAQRE